jgi:DNA-binding beta-propeller fold protein YncE
MRNRKLAASALCALATICLAAPAAHGAARDPLYQYFGVAHSKEEENLFKPFPPKAFEGPCGIAVDSKGTFYVADYYHDVVDAISSARHYLTQVTDVDSVDGPCGLAVDTAGNVYVEDYHRKVVRYSPSAFPVTTETHYGAPITIDSGEPSGIALDPESGRLYVDERTYIAVYESSGAPVEVAGHPLHIGDGSLEDGYGLAFSQYAGTAGRLYVADAGSDTVRVYDPAIDTVDPVEEIDGHENPTAGFVSLRDSAVAVDRWSGQIYVTDLLQPEGYERPEAAVYAFEANGEYAGRLKYNVIDARPPGLAVDNSAVSTFSRLYVTNGNSEGAGLYAYAPGSPAKSPAFCAPAGPCPVAESGEGAGFATNSQEAAVPGASDGAGVFSGAPAPSAPGRAVAAGASARHHRRAHTSSGFGGAQIVQKGTLRLAVSGELSPSRLPRRGTAPIAVSVKGQISTTDESEPPQLKALRIEFNRNGHLDFAGLPTCPYSRIQPASSARALAACRSALVGTGRFSANIVLSGQEPYPTEGKLLVFNGVRQGKPVLYGQIYSPHPFASSFVIVFSVHRISHGAYGTSLNGDLPRALGNWGYLTAIQMRLSRRYHYKGKPHSFLSAGCPAPTGFGEVPFLLARTSFSFAVSGKLSVILTRTCGVRG